MAVRGFPFGENGEHKLYEVSKAVAQIQYDLGKGKPTEPVTVAHGDCQRPENQSVSSTFEV